MQEIIIRIFGTIMSSGVILGIFNLHSERMKKHNDFGKALAPNIMEEVFSKFILPKNYNENTAKNIINKFCKELQSSRYSSYFYELLQDALELQELTGKNFEDKYRRFYIRYYETVDVLRKHVGVSVGKEQTKEARQYRAEIIGLLLMVPAIISMVLLGSIPFSKLISDLFIPMSGVLVIIGLFVIIIARSWDVIVISLKLIWRFMCYIYKKLPKLNSLDF